MTHEAVVIDAIQALRRVSHNAAAYSMAPPEPDMLTED